MNTIQTLMNLLEENGFEPSGENLDILISELNEGQTVILDKTNIALVEGMDEDYFYMQILDKNGFIVNENNLNVLKEAYDNGHVMLMEAGNFKEKLGEIGKAALRIAGATAIGAGIGSLGAHAVDTHRANADADAVTTAKDAAQKAEINTKDFDTDSEKYKEANDATTAASDAKTAADSKVKDIEDKLNAHNDAVSKKDYSSDEAGKEALADAKTRQQYEKELADAKDAADKANTEYTSKKSVSDPLKSGMDEKYGKDATKETVEKTKQDADEKLHDSEVKRDTSSARLAKGTGARNGAIGGAVVGGVAGTGVEIAAHKMKKKGKK